VKVLSDGTYLSVLINPAIRGAQRRKAIMAAAREITDGVDASGDLAELDPTEAHLGGWCEAAYAGALCVGRWGLVGSGVGRSWVVRGPAGVVRLVRWVPVVPGWALLFLLGALFVLVSGLSPILRRSSAGRGWPCVRSSPQPPAAGSRRRRGRCRGLGLVVRRGGGA
jgi:hypothetical protein